MEALNNMWKNYTLDFSFAQKVIVGTILGIILGIATMAVVLLIIELAK
ncbi:MAG TPA: hypothetical protein VFM59_00170 [Salinimicrobium sp.]|nr:hypothetical protein [Salinimicrobium sp.]